MRSRKEREKIGRKRRKEEEGREKQDNKDQ